MPRRRKKQRKTETRGEYLKRIRNDNDAQLRGRVVTSWKKGGRLIEVNERPPMLRADVRDLTFKYAVKKRTEPARDLGEKSGIPHESRYTVRPLGTRRKERRRRNRVARSARRANR